MIAMLGIALVLGGILPELREQPKAEPGVYASEAINLFVPRNAVTTIVRIPSPDKTKTVVVDYTQFYQDYNQPVVGYVEAYGKRFKIEPEYLLDPKLLWGVDSELAWAPDSKAFYVNYSDGGAVGGYHALIYYADPSGIRKTEPTRSVQRLYYSHPVACFGPNADNQHPRVGPPEEPNVGAVAWLGDSTRLLIAAEVPPHSSCDDMGTFRLYDVSLPTGRVLKSYGQIEAKKRFWKDLGMELRDADDDCILKAKSCWSPWLHPDLKMGD
jgi:hypothetical protein